MLRQCVCRTTFYCATALHGIRSFRLIVGSPDSRSPRLSQFVEAYLSFFKPEKRGKAWKDSDCTCAVTKIISRKVCSPCCRVFYVIGRIDYCPGERRSGESTFGRNDHNSTALLSWSLEQATFGPKSVNPLSPKIHIQILHTDLHTFLLRIFERIWFKIKAFSLW